MKKYLDHEGLAVYNGEYDLGGKQLEWANAPSKIILLTSRSG